jgi:hypothetical protein
VGEHVVRVELFEARKVVEVQSGSSLRTYNFNWTTTTSPFTNLPMRHPPQADPSHGGAPAQMQT